MRRLLRIVLAVLGIIWLAGEASLTHADVMGGFLKTDSGYIPIDYPGAGATNAYGINNSGQIVGFYEDQNALHGFTKTDAGYSSFDHPGASGTLVLGINDNGQIVGSYRYQNFFYQGFLKSDAGYTPINYPGIGTLSTFPSGINNFGQIVGYYSWFLGSGAIIPQWHSFLKTDAGYSSFDYPGANETLAYDINDSGQIVGQYDIFTPPPPPPSVPLPTTIILLGSGLGMLLFSHKKLTKN